MTMTYPAKHISISIQRSPIEVYDFASLPENLPKWAAGLSQSKVVKSGDHWVVDSPMGRVEVRFAPQNRLGVIDHDVTLPSGQVVHNPLRILKNNDGSEVVFTLYRLPEMSDQNFDEDARRVIQDLQTLKSLLEKKTTP